MYCIVSLGTPVYLWDTETFCVVALLVLLVGVRKQSFLELKLPTATFCVSHKIVQWASTSVSCDLNSSINSGPAIIDEFRKKS